MVLMTSFTAINYCVLILKMITLSEGYKKQRNSSWIFIAWRRIVMKQNYVLRKLVYFFLDFPPFRFCIWLLHCFLPWSFLAFKICSGLLISFLGPFLCLGTASRAFFMAGWFWGSPPNFPENVNVYLFYAKIQTFWLAVQSKTFYLTWPAISMGFAAASVARNNAKRWLLGKY